ncbi:hypothetical protein P692DRAFT_20739020 [Suillus brevipes Sb2]|nr:hypothetical protein P692DRAFT_20739020 [Suillus brevipes Sb2]
MIPSKPWLRSQATQNNPRTRERHTSLECHKSSLQVSDIDHRSARIDDFSKAIRATDLTLGLRRIPAGFHVAVKADGAEFWTSNKPVHVDQAVIEWHERILLPYEPSSNVQISVYASFESGPMLCHGEVLRKFEISVRELLDRSENSHPIIFQPEPGEVISPCTSLFMALEQRLPDETDVSIPCSLTTVSDQ